MEPECTSKCKTIVDALLALDESIDNVSGCSFLSGQMLLACGQSHARSCYVEFQKVLTLPRIRVLKDIGIYKLSASGNFYLSYIKNKVKC